VRNWFSGGPRSACRRRKPQSALASTQIQEAVERFPSDPEQKDEDVRRVG